MRRLPFAATLLAMVSTAAPAAAQTRLFAEDWETDASRWRPVDSNPINLLSDGAGGTCSSRFQRETVLIGGGRIFTRAGIPVRGGERYCVTAWIRGSTGTQPFLGINLSNAAGAVGAEHWLMGRAPYNNNYGGNVTDAPSDGAWHWLTAAFTVESTATHIVLKHELFSGGAAGTADFDDIQLWEGGCPSSQQGTPHATCAAPAGVCNPGGLCVQCLASSDCAGATPICDTARSVCVQCLSDSQCSGATPRCDTARSVCVACRTSADCSGATPACDTGTGVCIACRGDSDCGGSTPACTTTGACGECSASNSTRCTGARGVCDVARATCASCTATNTAACTASGDGAACVAGACGCATDRDCGDATSGRVCDASTRRCVAGCSPAIGRNGCPADRFCTSDDATGAAVGTCTTTCNFDADCRRTAMDRPLCLTGDAAPSACVACRADSDCAGRSDGRTLCDPDRYTCVECTAASAARCDATMRGGRCLTMGTCGCTADGDCGDTRSGRVCDATMSACVAGCREGGNGCPDGMRCVAPTAGAAGRCEVAPDASVDASSDVSASDVAISDVAISDVSVADGSASDASASDAAVADVAVVDVAVVDAALDAAPDATLTGDYSGDGCSCAVPGAQGTSHGALGLMALAGLAVVRRRRR